MYKSPISMLGLPSSAMFGHLFKVWRLSASPNKHNKEAPSSVHGTWTDPGDRKTHQPTFQRFKHLAPPMIASCPNRRLTLQRFVINSAQLRERGSTITCRFCFALNFEGLSWSCLRMRHSASKKNYGALTKSWRGRCRYFGGAARMACQKERQKVIVI